MTSPTTIRLTKEYKRHLEDNYNSITSGVVKLVKEDMLKYQDPFLVIKNSDNKIKEQKEIRQNAFLQLKNIQLQGNFEQREKAEKLIKFQEEKRQAKIEEYELIYNKIKTSKHYKDFSKSLNNGLVEDFNSIDEWATKFSKEFVGDKGGFILPTPKLFNLVKQLKVSPPRHSPISKKPGAKKK